MTMKSLNKQNNINIFQIQNLVALLLVRRT